MALERRERAVREGELGLKAARGEESLAAARGRCEELGARLAASEAACARLRSWRAEEEARLSLKKDRLLRFQRQLEEQENSAPNSARTGPPSSSCSPLSLSLARWL